MPDFSFRIRIVKAPHTTLNIDSPSWRLPLLDEQVNIDLVAYSEGKTIQESPELVLRGDSWKTQEEALGQGEGYARALMLSLARVRVGADFGARTAKSAFFSYGLKLIEEKSGQRALNDVHGLMVFETEPKPRFARLEVKGCWGVPKERFEKVFSYAVSHSCSTTDQEQISLELFHASMFQKSADARFILLMMAIEALLVPGDRSQAAIGHIDTLMRLTRDSAQLTEAEKDSIIGPLGRLRKESIIQTGRRLAAERLGPRIYSNKSAPDFFTDCYELRSKLVHGGSPFPSWEEVSKTVGDLEVFVSDLVSGPLLEIGT